MLMSFHGFNWRKIFGEDETRDRNGNKPGKEAENYSRENEKKDERMNISNPLFDISETELRDLCRHHIDSFENWSRRLLDEVFKDAYGQDYFNYMITEDQPLVKAEIKRRVEKRINDNPGRFPRKIDAIVMEDIEYFLCREDLYERHFKEILESFYSGTSEVRNVLERLIPIRNKLSHGNTISIHEAEQCLCYTDDLIMVFKQHYVEIGKERDYNVPIVLRIKDSLGHDFIREHLESKWEMHFYGITAPKIQLRSGERYKMWIEVDSSFDQNFYEIAWVVNRDYSTILKKGTGNVIDFTLTNKDVSYSPEITILLTTKRDWHRFRIVDDHITLNFDQILPPIEDTY